MAEYGGVVSDDEEFDVNVGRRAVNEEGLLPEATPPPAIEKVVTDVTLPYRLKVIAKATLLALGKFVADRLADMVPYAKFLSSAPTRAKPESSGVGRLPGPVINWNKTQAGVSSMAAIEDYAAFRHDNPLMPSVFGPIPGVDFEPPAVYPVNIEHYGMLEEPISTRGPRPAGGATSEKAAAFQKRIINIFSTRAIGELYDHAVRQGNIKLVEVTPAK